MLKLVKSGLPYAIMMALLLLGLFMFRSIYKPFYDFTSNYLIGIALIAVFVLVCYCRSLKPVRAREEGGLDWYVGRAWLMGLMGLVLGVGLVSGYAHQVEHIPNRQFHFAKAPVKNRNSHKEGPIKDKAPAHIRKK